MLKRTFLNSSQLAVRLLDKQRFPASEPKLQRHAFNIRRVREQRVHVKKTQC